MTTGIYIHIPFCRSRCAYCDFYSTTREAEAEPYIEALCREIAERSDELPSARVRTIYIGGGTPSVLSSNLLNRILASIYDHYTVATDAEVTLEMNPDDVLHTVVPEHVNRVSLGIQTFNDDLLRLIRRRHDASTAIHAVEALQAAGITNISIDLIYGLPNQTMELWESDLSTAFSLGVQHLSAYALSYEQGTLLTRWRDEGRIREKDDELSVAMYDRLCQRAHEAGFEHYEISNFALPDYRSRHNSSYWAGIPYLGFGPGAHSYDGLRTRRANSPNLDAYLSDPSFSIETLTDNELYDEAVMCSLRTREGISLQKITERFGQQHLDYLLRMAQPHLHNGRLILADGYLHLAEQALMVSDDIMSDLMSAE